VSLSTLVLAVSAAVCFHMAATQAENPSTNLQLPALVEPVKPCSEPEYRQFDFWVGDWELSWPASETSEGKPGRGMNRIAQALDDCVIVENFNGKPGLDLRGMSVSTFNKRTGKWQQTWVDSAGGYLDFIGEFQDGQMVLVREAVVSPTRKFLQRMVWKNIQRDSLDWSWERSDDGGETWKVLWPIHYMRERSAPAATPGREKPRPDAKL
jgi:hypothetical protein